MGSVAKERSRLDARGKGAPVVYKCPEQSVCGSYAYDDE